MKTIFLFLVLLGVSHVALGERLVPSALDPNRNGAREEVFTPWSNPEESGVNWRKLAGTNVPIYNERKDGGLSRDLYIPNPGVGYWVLGGLSEKQLWDTEREKIKIGDELVSASVYEDETGAKVYWALWTARNRAYLLKDRMRALGITPARVESEFSGPFSGKIVFHQQDGPVVYNVIVADGQVSGYQSLGSNAKPFAQIVGGWFDFQQGKLSLLIVATAEGIDPRWRAQAQHFRVDLPARQVTLEHMLYDYGQTVHSASDTPTAHVLDALDRVEHLVK